MLKPAESVQLKAYEVRPGEKLDCLRQLLYVEKDQTLIFTRTKRGTERLAKEIVRDGFTATMIHGDRSQSQRNGALSGFQEGHFQVLVATDIASRGLHVDNVAHSLTTTSPKWQKTSSIESAAQAEQVSRDGPRPWPQEPRCWNCAKSSEFSS